MLKKIGPLGQYAGQKAGSGAGLYVYRSGA